MGIYGSWNILVESGGGEKLVYLQELFLILSSIFTNSSCALNFSSAYVFVQSQFSWYIQRKSDQEKDKSLCKKKLYDICLLTRNII